jgi:hypothetical protein
MWLILCEPDDYPALWAFEGLKARGLDPLEIVTSQTLVYGLGWEHRLGGDGAHVSIRLHDARVIESARTRGVLNRLVYLPSGLFSHAPASDRLYAAGEMTALFMSWLAAMPAPMLNRPTAQGLCGSWRHPSEWQMLAARAGLATRPYHQSGCSNGAGSALGYNPTVDGTAFVIGSKVVGPDDLPPAVRDGCAALAAAAGQQLLGIDFTRDGEHRWTFIGASPRPDLRLGGDALLDALAEALRGATS